MFEKTQDIIRINPILAGFFGFFQRIVFFANPVDSYGSLWITPCNIWIAISSLMLTNWDLQMATKDLQMAFQGLLGAFRGPLEASGRSQGVSYVRFD